MRHDNRHQKIKTLWAVIALMISCYFIRNSCEASSNTWYSFLFGIFIIIIYLGYGLLTESNDITITGYNNFKKTDLEKLLAECKKFGVNELKSYEEIEDRYQCPITHLLPKRPVICNVDGNLYDLVAIKKWFKQNPAETPTKQLINRPLQLIRDRHTEAVLIEQVTPLLRSHQKTMRNRTPWRGYSYSPE